MVRTRNSIIILHFSQCVNVTAAPTLEKRCLKETRDRTTLKKYGRARAERWMMVFGTANTSRKGKYEACFYATTRCCMHTHKKYEERMHFLMACLWAFFSRALRKRKTSSEQLRLWKGAFLLGNMHLKGPRSRAYIFLLAVTSPKEHENKHFF